MISRELSLDNAINDVLLKYEMKEHEVYIQDRGRGVTMIYCAEGYALARIVTLFSDYMYESTITYLA